MELNIIEFFTFDEILGVEKCFAKRRTILDFVKAFDEANKNLYKQIVKLQKENKALKEKLKGVQMKQITITDKDLETLDRMLSVASYKQVIRKANFINIKTGEAINACFEYENFMFEKFGIFLKDNHLSEENKKILEQARAEHKEEE